MSAHTTSRRDRSSRLARRLGTGVARWRTAVGVAVALSAGAHARPAIGDIKDVRGTLSVGYSKLFGTDSPAGSMSTSAGLSYPVLPNLLVGPKVAFHLLGS